MVWWLVWLAFDAAKNIELVDQLVMAPIPEDSEVFLQGPGDVAFDGDGRCYVLDLRSHAVMVWNRDGSYHGHFGQPGQGPGEFSFRATMGGRQGYINIIGEDIFIYDGGNRVVSRFNRELAFVDSFKFSLPNGRAEQFRMISADKLLIFNSSYTVDEPFRQIATYDLKGNLQHRFIKAPDQTWRYKSADRSGVILHIYSPSLYMHYNSSNDNLIIGNSVEPKFTVYSPDGELIREYELPLRRWEVTESDIEEFEGQAWIQRNTFFSAEYPDEKAFYDQVIPVGDRGFLVFIMSPVRAHCQGIYADIQGKVQGKFKFTCGEGGGLTGSQGRVVAVRTNEDGDFEIAILRVASD